MTIEKLHQELAASLDREKRWEKIFTSLKLSFDRMEKVCQDYDKLIKSLLEKTPS